jgi:hypothetical protein
MASALERFERVCSNELPAEGRLLSMVQYSAVSGAQ